MFADLIFEITATTGTGNIVLGGARSSNFRRVADAYLVGQSFDYTMYGGTQFEAARGTYLGNGQVERTEIYDGSAGPGQPTDWLPGNKDFSVGLNSGSFLNIADLPALTQQAGDVVLTYRPTGDVFGTLLASSFGSDIGTPADTTGPAFANGAALSSSNVTTNSFDLAWPAATDAVGVARYEYSLDAGTSWVNVGNVLSASVSGRTASTTYPTRLRALDDAGNPSNVLSLSVTTAASADVTDPTMSGSLTTTNVTSSGYRMQWPAGGDNVAVVGYDTSIDAGTTWTQQGNTLFRDVTGRPASTTDQLRVRARDDAGRISNVLSTTVTTSAPAAQTMAQQYTLSSGPDYATTATFAGGTAPDQYFATTNNIYVRDTANGNAPPAGAVMMCYSKSSTTCPATWNGSAWSTSVPFSAGGGSANPVPNSVKALTLVGDQVSFKGLYTQSPQPYGGGTGGTFYPWILYSDGSAEAHTVGIVVS